MSSTSVEPVTDAGLPASANTRRAIAGGFFAIAVDAYDIYLPIVALTPALIYFQPKNLPGTITATIGYFVLAATMVGRPLGAVIFGYLGDVLGRRRAALIAIAGFSSLTCLMAILPGYQTWGYTAIVLMILIRFVDGVFMGGGYTGASPLAMESCPKRLRGVIGGVMQSSFSLGYALISVITLATLALAPAGAIDSPYVQWGWRVPFAMGGVLGFAFLAYYVRVAESETWEREVGSDVRKTPLADLLSGQNLKSLVQVFVLMSGLWLASQAIVSAMPGLLQNYLGQPAKPVTIAILIGNIALGCGYITAGTFGQLIGRRRMLMVCGGVLAVFATATYYLMVANALGGGAFPVTAVWAALTMVLGVSIFGIIPSYINERFPTRVRASGYGMGYSLAIIIPSLYSVYMLGLGRVMSYGFTPLVLSAAAGLLAILGAWLGPETRKVDLENVSG